MSTHPPGPWFPVAYGTEKKQWIVMRDLRDSGGACEFMQGGDRRHELFDSEEAALAAIAKAEAS